MGLGVHFYDVLLSAQLCLLKSVKGLRCFGYINEKVIYVYIKRNCLPSTGNRLTIPSISGEIHKAGYVY